MSNWTESPGIQKERRCYIIPKHSLDAEKELIRFCKAANILDALNCIVNSINVHTDMLCKFEAQDEKDEINVQLVGESLAIPVGMLNMFYSIIADYEQADMDSAA